MKKENRFNKTMQLIIRSKNRTSCPAGLLSSSTGVSPFHDFEDMDPRCLQDVVTAGVRVHQHVPMSLYTMYIHILNYNGQLQWSMTMVNDKSTIKGKLKIILAAEKTIWTLPRVTGTACLQVPITEVAIVHNCMINLTKRLPINNLLLPSQQVTIMV